VEYNQSLGSLIPPILCATLHGTSPCPWHCVWFRASMTSRSSECMVFVKSIEFLTDIEYRHCTSSSYPCFHLGHRFRHVFIHHDYVARVAVSTPNLLHLLWQHRHSPSSSLCALRLSWRPSLLVLSNTSVYSWWSLPSCVRHWQHRCVHSSTTCSWV
jgi:hypothetical protein